MPLMHSPEFVAEGVVLQPEQETRAAQLAADLIAKGEAPIRASMIAMSRIYSLHSVNAESLGGEYRAIWKRILANAEVKP